MKRLLLKNDSDREGFIKLLRSVDLKTPYTVELKKFSKPRSNNQNRLFHGWMRLLRMETGNDETALKQYFKEKYLSYEEKTCFDNPVIIVRGTSELSTIEFNDFMDNVRNEMLSEQGIFLPYPDEVGFDDFYAQYMG